MAKTILLVEDDEDIATLLRLNLQDEGYQIVHEADGGQALARLETQVWDAVILDLMLPGVDGLEICRRIRQMTRYLPPTTIWRSPFHCWSLSPASKRCFVARRRWGRIC